MEVFIVALMAMKCPDATLLGFDSKLNLIERQSLSRAKNHCSELYPEAPCLKKFIKREELVFWAICGEESK